MTADYVAIDVTGEVETGERCNARILLGGLCIAAIFTGMGIAVYVLLKSQNVL